MATVRCKRCGEDRAALTTPPWPGPDGEALQAQVCASCWQAWQVMQTKVINEYRLILSDPRHQDLLDDQMRIFLGLKAPPAPEEGLGTAPYGFGEGGPDGTGETR